MENNLRTETSAASVRREVANDTAPEPSAPQQEARATESPAARTIPSGENNENRDPIRQAPTVSVTRQEVPSADIAALVARGDQLLAIRDVASARLFYERAALAGDGQGALRLGMTFDPVFLGRAGMAGMRGDAGQALSWYRRAADLGNPEAKRLLGDLQGDSKP